MYHLTANSDTSLLTLNFVNDGVIVATMRIAQSCGRFVRDGDTNLSYIDKGESRNIDYISKIEEIDQLTPIQIYCGNDPSLSKILLLEETEYDIELTLIEEGVTDVLGYLQDNEQSLNLKQNRFTDGANCKLYTLYFKSYVGKGFFDINYRSALIKIPFEVRSKKIEYLQDYPRMLSDIAEFSTSLLLDPGSPLYRNYGGSYKTSKTTYEDFLVLDYIFSKCCFESNYEYVRNNIYSELTTDIEEADTGLAVSVDVGSVISMIDSRNLVSVEKGIINGIYNPRIIRNEVSIDTFDVPENRLIKDLLLTLQALIYSVNDSSIPKKSAYISDRIDYMRCVIDEYVSDRWISDVADITYVPFESMILQERNGYSDLFHIYQILNIGIALSQDDVPDLFEGHNKKVYQIYEYWCYTRLYKCLFNLSENKPSIEPNITNKRKIITIQNKAVDFVIKRNGSFLNVRLYYNKNFDQDDEKFRSYSVKLRPDFTLVVEKSKKSYIINFDSKYKMKIKDPNDTEMDDSKIDSGCWEYDIYKMHTYRDALIKSLGSYVLYPGKSDDSNLREMFIKPRTPESWFERNKYVLPSVGAIPLIPGLSDDRLLYFAIESILDRLSAEAETYYI